MVVQTNELEFKGQTLQEYLEWKYPEKEDKEGVGEISIKEINYTREKAGITKQLEGGELDLREFKNAKKVSVSNFIAITKLTKLNIEGLFNLTSLYCYNNNLTSLDVSGCVNLTEIWCSDNNLTSIDFLNQLPHPEKLLDLGLANNNIKPTNLEFLRPFVNLTEKLTLGNDRFKRYNNNIYNRFYGSLEPLKNMTKLSGLCIDGTDVEEGIEYLPVSNFKGRFNCDPKLPNQKVAKIQNELRPYNYDIEAWQLAHPEKMLISRPEYFTNPDSKEQWIKALTDKITNTQSELSTAKTNETDKLSKIARLETTIQELTQAKTQISRQTQTEFSTQNKGTQTDLTAEQITQLEQDSQTFLKLLQATEQELTNTKHQLTQIQEKLTNQNQVLQIQIEVKTGELQQAKVQSNKLSSELETAQEKNKTYLENIKNKEGIINDNNQQIKQLESQLQTSQTELTTQSVTNQELTNTIKQLQSKIKLLEQQKENYQTKYDQSINFIKEISQDIAKM